MENENAALTKTEKIRLWLGGKAGKRSIVWALLLYIAGTAAHYLMGCFPKRIATYCDELLYYTIAQSIHDSGEILCLNAHTTFDRTAYSFVLSPFFGIDDPILRVKMITLFNSALIMTSLIFVCLIGRELELNRGSMLAALAVTAVWPDLMYSTSFMSENLNWPLTLLAILLWIRSRKSRYGAVYSAILGAVCYIGYLCKNIFLALLLSTAAFEVLYPIVKYLTERRETPGFARYWSKQGLIRCGISVAVFAVCLFAGGLLLNGEVDSNAVGAVAIGLKNLNSVYAVLYLLFAFVYYLAAACVAVMVMPIAYSTASFRRMDENTRTVFSFLSLYLVISCAMIAYTISIKEDIGSTFPRGHLRYFGFILLLLTVVFFRVLQDEHEDEKFSRKRTIFTLTAAFLSCMIFRGFSDVSAAIDQSVLNVYHAASLVLQGYIEKVGEKRFYTITFVSFALFAMIILIVHYYKSRKKSGAAAGVFLMFMLMLCVQNSRLEHAQYRDHYHTDEKMIDEVLTLDSYLEPNGGNILYICQSRYSIEHKTFTTYFNYIDRLCVCHEETVPSYTADGRVIDVPNTELELFFADRTITYDKFDGFDYIVTDHKCRTELRGVSRVDEASGEFYTLYRNTEPAAVEIVPDAYAGKPLEITFGDGGNADKFYDKGIEENTKEIPWTNGDRASFNIPVLGEYGAVEIAIDVAETYNNTAQRYIVVCENEVLSEGTLTGAGRIVFTVPVKNNVLSFDLVCPTAVRRSDEEWILGDVSTGFAFRLRRMTAG